MPPFKRLRAAYNALTAKPAASPSLATVRPYEANPYSQRFRRLEAGEAAMRWVGTVKVAGSRNAQAVASLPLRVYTDASAPTAKWYARKAVPRRELLRLRSTGTLTRKSAGMSDEVVEVVDDSHPAVALLDQPNANMSGFELIEGIQQHLGIFGDAYLLIVEVGGLPVQLWPLNPIYVHPIPDRENFIGGYVYGRGTEIERTYTAGQIIHFRYSNPRGDPYHGLSDLAACAAEADLGRSMVLFAQSMIEREVVPGMVVTAPDATPEQARTLEEHLNQRFMGKNKAGASVVLYGNLEAQIRAMGEKEMAFLQSMERVDQTIANCHDMPTSILRLDTAALATAKAAIPQWQMMAIRPRATRISDFLNRRLVSRYWPGYYVEFDEAVDKDTDAAAARVGALVNTILTVNECRAELDYDAMEGEENDVLTPAPDPNAAPPLSANLEGTDKEGAGSSSSKAATPNSAMSECVKANTARLLKMGLTEPEARVAAEAMCEVFGMGGYGGGLGFGAAVAAGASLAGRVDLGRKSDSGLSARGLLWQDHPDRCCQPGRISRKDDKLHGHFIAANERQLEAALRQWFDGVTPHIVGSVTEAGTLGIDLSSTAVTSSFETAVQTILSNLYQAGGRAGVADVQHRVDPQRLRQALTEGAQDYLRNQTAKLSESVTGTLDGRLGNTLADGVQAGENVTQLRDRVMEVMDKASKSGAENIARTETSRAFLSAREEAWKVSGVVEGKEWLLSADPCPLCMAMARKCNAALGGKAVPLGDALLALGATLAAADGSTLTNDYQVMMTPPLHPQCRCSMGAVFKGTTQETA